jgi:hypothetical protein
MANNVTLSSLAAALNQLGNGLGAPAQQTIPTATASPLTAASAASTAGSTAGHDHVSLGQGKVQPLTYDAKGKLSQSPTVQALLNQHGNSMLQSVLGGDTSAGSLAADLMSASGTVDLSKLNQQMQHALAARTQQAGQSGHKPAQGNAGDTKPTGTHPTTGQSGNAIANSALARAIQQNPALLEQLKHSTATQGLINILG